MPAATVNLTEDRGFAIHTGVTWQVQGTFYQDKTKQNPVNLTGASAKMQIRDETGSTDALLEITTSGSAGDKITLGGAAGTYDIQASAATTASLAPGRYVYDFLLTDSGGTVTKEFEGLIEVIQSVTRD